MSCRAHSSSALVANALGSLWSTFAYSTRISLGRRCRKIQAKRLLFSSPLGQVYNMAAMRSDGFLLPKAGIWNSFSAFWKSVS